MKRRRIARSRAEGRVSSAAAAVAATATAGAIGMARKCCVRNCETDIKESRAKGLPLHKFPKDAALRGRWLTSDGFDESFKPTLGQVVCHRHFKRADYEATRGHKFLLKKGSVPTVFADYDNHPGMYRDRCHDYLVFRKVKKTLLDVKQRSYISSASSSSSSPPPPTPSTMPHHAHTHTIYLSLSFLLSPRRIYPLHILCMLAVDWLDLFNHAQFT